MQNRPIRFFILGLILLALGSILLAACARPGTASSTASNGGSSSSSGSSNGSSSSSSSSSSSGGSTTVHLGDSTFLQSTVTLSKGSSLKMVNDVAVPHIIQNGSWDNGVAKSAKESGAPTVQVQFQGNDSQTVGPFATAGTFHLYCTIHQGMNLTVVVQ